MYHLRIVGAASKLLPGSSNNRNVHHERTTYEVVALQQTQFYHTIKIHLA